MVEWVGGGALSSPIISIRVTCNYNQNSNQNSKLNKRTLQRTIIIIIIIIITIITPPPQNEISSSIGSVGTACNCGECPSAKSYPKCGIGL